MRFTSVAVPWRIICSMLCHSNTTFQSVSALFLFDLKTVAVAELCQKSTKRTNRKFVPPFTFNSLHHPGTLESIWSEVFQSR